MSEEMCKTGVFEGNTGASAVWPGAGNAYYYPIFVPDARTFTKAWWLNGATAAGNVDVGIFTIAGTTATLVAASTAVAQAGISAIQVATTFGPVTLTPGLYYLAMSMSLATGTRWGSAPSFRLTRIAGCYQRVSAHPLSTAGAGAVAQIGSSVLPVFGFSEGSDI